MITREQLIPAINHEIVYYSKYVAQPWPLPKWRLVDVGEKKVYLRSSAGKYESLPISELARVEWTETVTTSVKHVVDKYVPNVEPEITVEPEVEPELPDSVSSLVHRHLLGEREPIEFKVGQRVIVRCVSTIQTGTLEGIKPYGVDRGIGYVKLDVGQDRERIFGVKVDGLCCISLDYLTPVVDPDRDPDFVIVKAFTHVHTTGKEPDRTFYVGQYVKANPEEICRPGEKGMITKLMPSSSPLYPSQGNALVYYSDGKTMNWSLDHLIPASFEDEEV